MKSALQEWIEGLMPKPYRTKRAVAKAAGLTESAFWRQVSTGKLGILPLLRLARATDVSPRFVLELANKKKLADAIEACYGQPPRPGTHAIRDVVETLEQHPSTAPVVARFLRDFLAHGPARSPAHKSPAAGEAAATNTQRDTAPPRRRVRV